MMTMPSRPAIRGIAGSCRALETGYCGEPPSRMDCIVACVRRSPPEVAEHAGQGADGDHEQHRAGVLGECPDHARGEAAGERGEPGGVAVDRCEQAPVAAYAERG